MGNSQNYEKPNLGDDNKFGGNKNYESKGKNFKKNSYLSNADDTKKKIITKDKVVITTGVRIVI